MIFSPISPFTTYFYLSLDQMTELIAKSKILQEHKPGSVILGAMNSICGSKYVDLFYVDDNNENAKYSLSYNDEDFSNLSVLQASIHYSKTLEMAGQSEVCPDDLFETIKEMIDKNA